MRHSEPRSMLERAVFMPRIPRSVHKKNISRALSLVFLLTPCQSLTYTSNQRYAQPLCFALIAAGGRALENGVKPYYLFTMLCTFPFIGGAVAGFRFAGGTAEMERGAAEVRRERAAMEGLPRTYA